MVPSDFYRKGEEGAGKGKAWRGKAQLTSQKTPRGEAKTTTSLGTGTQD